MRKNAKKGDTGRHGPRRPTIGVLVSIVHRHQPFWLGAVDAARTHDVNLVCFVGGALPASGQPHVQHFSPHNLPSTIFNDLVDVERLDGLITWAGSGVGLGMHLDPDEMAQFIDRYRALPIVNYEGHINGVPSVSTDTYRGMCELLAHLIEVHECRRIAFIRGPLGHWESEERNRAYLDTLTRYGLPIDPALICPPAGWGTWYGGQMVGLLLDERKLRPGHDFDALATTEIDYAVGAVPALRTRGIHVPDQVAVVGFNDQLEAQFAEPPITVMRKSFDQAGSRAVETVLDMIAGKPVPEQIDVPAQLVLRRSCERVTGRTGQGSPGTVGADDAHEGQRHTNLVHRLGRLVLPEQAEFSAICLLSSLVDALCEARTGAELAWWQTIIDKLSGYFRSCPASDARRPEQIDQFLQQVQTIIGQEIERVERDQWPQNVDYSRVLLEISQEMMNADTIPHLIDALVHRLPDLGIGDCYLALYQEPQSDDASTRSAPEWSRLVLAVRDGQRIDLEPEGRLFRTRHLAPDALLPQDRAYALVATSLYFGRRLFGFVLLQVGPRDGAFYQALAQEISSALQSVFLMHEYQQTERARRESEARMRTLIEHIPVAFWAKGADGKYVMQNSAMRQLIGDNLGSSLDEIAIDEELKALWKAQDERAFDGKTVYAEHTLRSQDQARVFQQIVAPVQVDGKITAILGLMIDVTEQKQMEASLRQAKDAALEAQRAAEAVNRAKSQFLANMGHELRTPLTAILGFAELMLHDDSLATQQRGNLEIISRSAEHLLALINDVLDLSKIEAGRLELQPEVFDLHEMLLGLGEMFSLCAREKGLTVVFDLAPGVPQYVYADPRKLRQVLINLLGNAVKFTEKGSVTMNVKRSAEQGANPPDQSDQRVGVPVHLFFEIQDTGAGIAPAEMDQIFDAFVQAESGRRSGQGTGLGLPISREYVRLMGGNLTVQSELGKGSCFCFDIRVNLPTTAELEALRSATATRRVVGLTPGQQAPDGGPFRLLVAEDVEANRELLVRLLRPLGFELREATNGQEALAIWQSWRPHLIWMDMRMPVMDGREVTRRIKATPQGQQTVIVALTASSFAEQHAEILAAGCDDFVRKPFRESEIFDVLRHHLGIRFVETAPVPTAEVSLSRDSLAKLPGEWVAAMRRAVVMGGVQDMLDLIGQVSQIGGDLGLVDRLTELVYRFEHDEILTWLQERGEA